MTSSEFTTLRQDIRETREDLGHLRGEVVTMRESLAACQSRCHVEGEHRRQERAAIAPWVQNLIALAALAISVFAIIGR